MRLKYAGRPTGRVGKKGQLVYRLLMAALAITLLVLTVRIAFKLAYPLKYSDLVYRYAMENELDPAMVFAVIRCESGFDSQAVSSADAKGLMQLTDDTFAWLQTKTHEQENLDPSALFDPQTNIRYGTLLLKLHTQEFGQAEYVLAAYHAGRGIVNQWISAGWKEESTDLAEGIPYLDTRAYVSKVLRTEKIYKIIYDQLS